MKRVSLKYRLVLEKKLMVTVFYAKCEDRKTLADVLHHLFSCVIVNTFTFLELTWLFFFPKVTTQNAIPTYLDWWFSLWIGESVHYYPSKNVLWTFFNEKLIQVRFMQQEGCKTADIKGSQDIGVWIFWGPSGEFFLVYKVWVFSCFNL